MKISVPARVEYSAQWYGVSYKKHMRTDDHLTGCLNCRTRKVEIDPDETKEERDLSFVHENLHIIDIKYKTGLDEDNIERLSNGLMELFKNLGIELDWSGVK